MKIILASILVLLILGSIFYQKMFVFGETVPVGPSEGIIAMVNGASGKMIRPKAASAIEGAAMELFSPRPWTCVAWHMQMLDSNSITLQNVLSGMSLTTDPTNAAIQKSTSSNLKAATLHLIKYGQGYLIENEEGLCLTGTEAPGPGVNKVFFAPGNGSPNQAWTIVKCPAKLFEPVSIDNKQ